jgi:hypothetical protein
VTKVLHSTHNLADRKVLRWMALLLPALTQEADVRSEDSERVTDVAEGVVRLASLDPSSFRLVLGQMHGKQKEYLTEVLREALVDKKEVNVEVQARPTISLTLDFGSIE